MLGSSCSPCCAGCTASSWENIYNTLVSRAASVTISGTFPVNEAATFLPGTVWGSASTFSATRSTPGTARYPDGGNQVYGYTKSPDVIGTHELAFVPASSSYIAEPSGTQRHVNVLFQKQIPGLLVELQFFSVYGVDGQQWSTNNTCRILCWVRALSYPVLYFTSAAPDTIFTPQTVTGSDEFVTRAGYSSTPCAIGTKNYSSSYLTPTQCTASLTSGTANYFKWPSGYNLLDSNNFGVSVTAGIWKQSPSFGTEPVAGLQPSGFIPGYSPDQTNYDTRNANDMTRPHMLVDGDLSGTVQKWGHTLRRSFWAPNTVGAKTLSSVSEVRTGSYTYITTTNCITSDAKLSTFRPVTPAASEACLSEDVANIAQRGVSWSLV